MILKCKQSQMNDDVLAESETMPRGRMAVAKFTRQQRRGDIKRETERQNATEGRAHHSNSQSLSVPAPGS